MVMGRSKRTKVFISYSHKDAAALERLQVHLKPLERQGIVDRWDDTQILAGQDWKAEIEQALAQARVAILLVSADFLASSFIARDELPRILLAQEQEGLAVLPVILKPCRFKRTPTLNKFQSVNPPSKPLLGLKEIEQENIWVKLGDRVEDILDDADEIDSAGVEIVIGGEKESTAEPPSTTSEVSNPIPVTAIDVSDLKLGAMRAEIEGDIGKATELWHQILAKVPSDSEATRQLTRLEQLSGTAKLDNSQPAEPENFAEALGNGVLLELMSIPDGTFLMGSPESEEGRFENEGPQHEVTISSFWMGKYPVTQAQWKIVAGWPKVNRDLELSPSQFKGKDRPVERVSWYETQEFCERLSIRANRRFRLPSEAEWEYACRAGTTTPYFYGHVSTKQVANYSNSYIGAFAKAVVPGQSTTSVGKYMGNAFGLYDMHGNVREWCADWWHEHYEGAPPGGTPWIKERDENKRVLRGGSWLSPPGACRSAFRGRVDPEDRSFNVGFRVACSPASRSS